MVKIAIRVVFFRLDMRTVYRKSIAHVFKVWPPERMGRFNRFIIIGHRLVYCLNLLFEVTTASTTRRFNLTLHTDVFRNIILKQSIFYKWHYWLKNQTNSKYHGKYVRCFGHKQITASLSSLFNSKKELVKQPYYILAKTKVNVATKLKRGMRDVNNKKAVLSVSMISESTCLP